MSELTYVLGAGASYQSIPVVKTFSSRFSFFINEMKSTLNPAHIDRDTVLKFINEFYVELLAHSTFDTLFKKLFHSDNAGVTTSIYKQILNLYFLWEHFKSTEELKDIKKTDDFTFKKEAKIDKRYDALIAGLLKPIPKKLELFRKVNFISWNYDLNLISSIKNFYFNGYAYKDVLEQIKESDKIWNVYNEMKIINMNGYFYSHFLDNIHDYYKANPEKYIRERLLETDALISGKDERNANKISFAWEEGVIQKRERKGIIENAKMAIKASDTIVIIGYSFPLYNRLTDFEYFNGNVLKGKTVYIQDPNAIEMIESIKSDFSIRTNNADMNFIPQENFTEIKPIIKCDSFFVPNSIFSYKDSFS